MSWRLGDLNSPIHQFTKSPTVYADPCARLNSGADRGAVRLRRETSPWRAARAVRDSRRPGRGRDGEVYKARDTRLDRTVAIKILSSATSADPDARLRFEREARTISQLSHPHICALYDVGEVPNPQSPIP